MLNCPSLSDFGIRGALKRNVFHPLVESNLVCRQSRKEGETQIPLQGLDLMFSSHRIHQLLSAFVFKGWLEMSRVTFPKSWSSSPDSLRKKLA
ncbi:hypothetical protein TNIN_256961 [Trichonephila inaurata madagascariensis]|uniref:Uncharacterized protein n=1 Tax=Trichonephila inaurata madagascariensis TaxID=2747483 RepID=A0A8X6Y0K8_9ARAC|nr:hypothetical protein TNIN_256961 [Trichonephila inaurata madagascariensis]